MIAMPPSHCAARLYRRERKLAQAFLDLATRRQVSSFLEYTPAIASWSHLSGFRRMAPRLAPGIRMPDSPSEQPPCPKQENNCEHQQARNKQECSASQVV